MNSKHIMFHGTDDASASKILSSGEFAAGTYFSHHMEQSLKMGGSRIFEVVFDEKPTDYWEWISPEPVPVSQVRMLIDVSPSLIFHNHDCERELRKAKLLERYDGDVKFCDECDGRGQMEYFEPFTARSDMSITRCVKCNGHGAYTVDGSHVNEHLLRKGFFPS